MKSFIYLTLFFASVGTVYVAVTNPEAVQQGAALLGFDRDKAADTEESEADHLAKFLADYPYNGKNEEPAAHPADENRGLNAVNVQPAVLPPPPVPPPAAAKQPSFEPPMPMPVPAFAAAEAPVANNAANNALNNTANNAANNTLPIVEPLANDMPPLEPMVQVSSENMQPLVPAPVPQPFTQPIPIQQTAAVQEKKNETVQPEQREQTQEQPLFPAPVSALPEEPEEAGFAVSKKSGGTNTANVPPPVITENVQPVQPQLPMVPPPSPHSVYAEQVPAANVFSPPSVPQPQETQEITDPFLRQNEEVNTAAALPTQPIPPPVAQYPPVNIAPPVPAPAVSPAAAQSPIASQYKVAPSVLAEEVPCHGTELVARVGTQVILMCDVLPQLRRIGMKVMQENVEKASEEERKMLTDAEKEKFVNMFVEHQYPAFLQEQITIALIYNDFLANQDRDKREYFNKKFEEGFDQREIPAMMKEFHVQGLAELKTYLKSQLGSSLERERMLWVRSKIAQEWIMHNVQQASGECTHDEMMDFYRSHLDMFTTQARVQWRELFVSFANHKTEQEARNKIAWMGNQVAAGGHQFGDIARVNSEGFTASKDGVWDWTKRGALSSQELENAVFTLPAGKMSPIIRSDKGFHIVQVIQREETKTTPFIDAQVKIREQIRMQRRKKYENDYSAELKRRYPTSILRDKIDFRL